MRVITWNIQWGRGADGVVNLSRTLETLADLGPADVICLQEVASNFPGLAGGRIDDGPAVFREAFPDYTLIDAPAVDVAGEGGRRARFGNLVLSRLPVGEVSRHRLPWPPEAGVPSMPRCVVEAVLMPPGRPPLRILTTHLEYYAKTQRRAQVQYLCRLQVEAQRWAELSAPAVKDSGPFARPPTPLAAIACGDFNCEPGSPEWCEMTGAHEAAAGWFDAWQLANPSLAHPPSVGLHGAEWPDREYCCDFFFVTRPLIGAVRRVHYDALSAASDHQPVVLDLW